MSELSVLKNQEKRSENRMEQQYLQFDHRLREIEQELYLYPYAKLSEVISWGEKLKSYIGKIEVIREQSIKNSQVDWDKLFQNFVESIAKGGESSSVFVDYVIFLVELGERYRQRVYVFANFIDNCVRYIKKYVQDLEEQGYPLNKLLQEVKNLYEMNWLSVLR